MIYTTKENLNNWLQKNLSKERYEHSIGTAECAQNLAERFGLDPQKAYFTGLVHDCAKCLSKEKTQEILHVLGIEPDNHYEWSEQDLYEHLRKLINEK